MKAVAKEEVSGIMDADASLPHQENERAAGPQCSSAPPRVTAGASPTPRPCYLKSI